MSLPSYAVNFRGLPACPCLATWLPVYEAELQRRGALVGPLRLYQLIGGTEASAGTHSQGGAFDITDLVGPVDVEVARKMGADASWARTEAQGFTPHIHGVLTGCSHNGPAHYQIDAVRAGFNGLGRNGHGGPDDGPRPLSGRTWREGIAWAQRQREKDWFEMATKDELRAVVREELQSALAGADIPMDQRDGTRKPENFASVLRRIVKKIGA